METELYHDTKRDLLVYKTADPDRIVAPAFALWPMGGLSKWIWN